MDSESCILAWDDPGPLQITFHRTARVGDHEDPSKQTVATAVEQSLPCKLTRWPPDGDEKTYLLALDCPAGRALSELDAFGICASTGGATNTGVKLEIKVEGENVAFPPLYRWEQVPTSKTRRQDYFFLSNTESESDEEWIHGIAVKEEPRLVRQFVVRNDGTGASIQNQVTGMVVPGKMGVVEIEATFAQHSSEVVTGSPTNSTPRRSSGNSVAAPLTVDLGLSPVPPVDIATNTQSDRFPFPFEPPFNATPTDWQTPRVTPPPAPPLSDPPDRPHMDPTTSLDQPSLSPEAFLEEPFLPPETFRREPGSPIASIREYYLYIQVDKVYTIQQPGGGETRDHFIGTVRVDHFEPETFIVVLKDLVADRIRRELATDDLELTVALRGHDYDPLAVETFDLVYKGQVLHLFDFAEDYNIYSGCTLEVTYRERPASPLLTDHDMDMDFAGPPVAHASPPPLAYAPPSPVAFTPPPHRFGSPSYESLGSDDVLGFDDLEMVAHASLPPVAYAPPLPVSFALPPPTFPPHQPNRRHRLGAEPLVPAPHWFGSPSYESLIDEDLLGGGKLEILPGGLIAQPLPNDPGTYDWASQRTSKLSVRIVSLEQFRNITGQEPPMPPELPGGPRLRRRDERNLGGTDSMLVSNAEYQFKHQVPGGEFGTSSASSRRSRSIIPEDRVAGNPNTWGTEGLRLPTTNLAVINAVPDEPRGTGATLLPAGTLPPDDVSRMKNNGTTGHPAFTEESSGRSRTKHSVSKVTMPEGGVSGRKKTRGGNSKAETVSGTCNCCICM